jgi:hypothetical protein
MSLVIWSITSEPNRSAWRSGEGGDALDVANVDGLPCDFEGPRHDGGVASGDKQLQPYKA